MLEAILKATNSSYQEGMIFGRSTYVKKIMKLLAFIFEQPSYLFLSDENLYDTSFWSTDVFIHNLHVFQYYPIVEP